MTRQRYKNIIAITFILSSYIISANAMASNGLFALGYGAKQVGIAGSGVAFPQDALIASINPAGVAFVGEQNNINLQYFSPSRNYTVDGPMGMGAPFPGPTVDIVIARVFSFLLPA